MQQTQCAQQQQQKYVQFIDVVGEKIDGKRIDFFILFKPKAHNKNRNLFYPAEPYSIY